MTDARTISTRMRPRLLAGLAAGAASLFGQRVEAVPDSPDIVVLLINDARTGDEIAMPRTMARLRDGGTTFPNFFLTTPLCGPSRATIFTGLYSHNTGVHQNTDGKNGGWLGFARHGNRGRTTGVLLQKAGYHTVTIGGYINGEQPGRGKEPGWDVGPVASKKRHQKGGGKRKKAKRDKDAKSDQQRTAAAIAAIEAVPEDQPLYLHLGFFVPHAPSKPALPYKGRFAGRQLDRDDPAFDEADMSDKPRYMRSLGRLGVKDKAWLDGQHQKRLECLSELDDHITEIWTALEARGRLDNTYVFLFTDNGYLLGQHRYYGKHVPYDGSVRMPLYAYGPKFLPDTIDERLVGNVDIAPTLVELAEVADPPPMDGVSLLSSHERDAILLEFLSPNVNSMKWRGPRTSITRYSALRTRTQLYVEYHGGEREYYDYEADPHETDNLLARSPSEEVRAAVEPLVERLGQLRNCRGSACL